MVLTKHQIETFSIEEDTYSAYIKPNDYFLEMSDDVAVSSLIKIRIKDIETYIKRDDLRVILNNL